MAILKAKKRNKLAKKSFGDPASRSYPMPDAAHVRNAAARLEQQKSSMSPSKYAKIRARIAAAAKAKGVKSKYNAKGGK